MEDRRLNYLLKNAAGEINLVSLVNLSWETLEHNAEAADKVKVTVDYTEVVNFLNTYGERKGNDTLFSVSLPDIKAIEEVVDHAIECGIGSNYLGRDDFKVVEKNHNQKEELSGLLQRLGKSAELTRDYSNLRNPDEYVIIDKPIEDFNGVELSKFMKHYKIKQGEPLYPKCYDRIHKLLLETGTKVEDYGCGYTCNLYRALVEFLPESERPEQLDLLKDLIEASQD